MCVCAFVLSVWIGPAPFRGVFWSGNRKCVECVCVRLCYLCGLGRRLFGEFSGVGIESVSNVCVCVCVICVDWAGAFSGSFLEWESKVCRMCVCAFVLSVWIGPAPF